MALSRRSFLKAAGVGAAVGTVAYAALRGRTRASRGSGGNSVRRYDRALLIGIDGLDPRLLGLLKADGSAGNFARLTGGELSTLSPVQSPVVWTSLATGTNPAKHGVFDFIHRDPATYRLFLSVTQSARGGIGASTRYVRPRRNAAFWNALTDADIPVTVVRWPVTFPPEPINGRMLAGLGVPDIRGMLGRYTFYTDDASCAAQVPRESLAQVQVQAGRVETVVKGPRIRGLTGQSDATVPLAIRWDSGRGVTVEAAGKSVTLQPGVWSEWVRLKFPAGPLKSLYGIVKFYLTQREPSFQLYMTAVELDPERPALPLTTPGGYAADLAGRIGTFHTLGMPEETKAVDDHVLSLTAFAEQCDEITEDRFRMFWQEFEQFKEGVFAFVFDTSDRIQHMFWKQNVFDAHGKVTAPCPHIRQHYLAMDRFLGRVLDGIDGRTALLVFSDHGFTRFDTSFDLNAWLAAEGLMALTASPASETDDESGLYKLVDWARTKAYGCGFSSICLNLRGREGEGIVEASEAAALKEQIVRRLSVYRDPQTGRQPVPHVYRAEDIFSGPLMAEAPDLVIGCAPGYRMSWQTAVGGVRADVLQPNERQWSGDHIVAPSYVPATILSNAPLDLTGATALDVAPTVTALLGLPPLADCDGRPLPFGGSGS